MSPETKSIAKGSINIPWLRFVQGEIQRTHYTYDSILLVLFLANLSHRPPLFPSPSVVQWLASWAHNPKVPGSNPGQDIFDAGPQDQWKPNQFKAWQSLPKHWAWQLFSAEHLPSGLHPSRVKGHPGIKKSLNINGHPHKTWRKLKWTL